VSVLERSGDSHGIYSALVSLGLLVKMGVSEFGRKELLRVSVK
jgi:hypothetical protein